MREEERKIRRKSDREVRSKTVGKRNRRKEEERNNTRSERAGEKERKQNKR